MADQHADVVRDVLAHYGEPVGRGRWVLYDVDIEKIAIHVLTALGLHNDQPTAGPDQRAWATNADGNKSNAEPIAFAPGETQTTMSDGTTVKIRGRS